MILTMKFHHSAIWYISELCCIFRVNLHCVLHKIGSEKCLKCVAFFKIKLNDIDERVLKIYDMVHLRVTLQILCQSSLFEKQNWTWKAFEIFYTLWNKVTLIREISNMWTKHRVPMQIRKVAYCSFFSTKHNVLRYYVPQSYITNFA